MLRPHLALGTGDLPLGFSLGKEPRYYSSHNYLRLVNLKRALLVFGGSKKRTKSFGEELRFTDKRHY